MGLKYFLLGTSLLCGLVISPALSSAADSLSPRAEVSVKGGSERLTLTTEFWAPLAQKSDRVVYTDLRLMGDDDDNREGNLGIGYRQIYAPTNSVLGVHGWIDRRRTEHNSTFHQVTLGAESLGDKLDLRLNGYVPLNGSHTVITPNLGSATPYLAGNGLFYDTTGSVSETPQYGLDAEAGYRLPIFEKQVDTIRVFGGSYYFFRDNTDSVLGGRARIESQINSIFSIGARFQYDKPRGSQGFLEATLRFPFSAKKLYQKSGLTSRLDESPERDIDIVTASKVDTGLHKEVLNTSGTQQRIFYVDNTQTNGDGTKEHPFNNLQSAQAALQANDILYIFRGDGTTRNMDQGITISQPGVQLIGSGSPLTVSGITFLQAGTAPTLTNTQPWSGLDEVTGVGILGLADNLTISGVTVKNAPLYGIRIAAVGTDFQNVTITNNTITSNNGISLIVHSQQNGTINNVKIDNNTILNGHSSGIYVQANSGQINNVEINQNLSTGNTGQAVNIQAINGGFINTVNAENNTMNNNTGSGFNTTSSGGGIINNLFLKNNMMTANNVGINLTGSLKNVDISSNTVSNNLSYGIAFAGVLQTNTINIANSSALNNGANGIFILVNGSTSSLNQLTLSNLLSSGNNALGIYIQANLGGTIGNVQFSQSAINNNSNDNIRIESNGTGGVIGQVSLSNINANNSATGRGVYLFAQTGSTINNVSLSQMTTNNNKLYGTAVVASGAINNAALSGITANNNLSHGIVLQTVTSTSAILNNASISNSNAIGNTGNGVYIQKLASSTLSADLGGGGLSVGQNRIFGNTANDMNIDRATVSAANNWWNNGGAAPTRVTLTNGGAVTYTSPLATDPRP